MPLGFQTGWASSNEVGIIYTSTTVIQLSITYSGPSEPRGQGGNLSDFEGLKIHQNQVKLKLK